MRSSIRQGKTMTAGTALALASLLLPAVARAASDSWSSLGPQGGDVTAIALDPSHSGTVYAGTIWGYVFKSIDSGASWTNTSSGLAGSGTVWELAVDPSRPGTVYAGANQGLWKSADGGASWSMLLSVVFVGALAIDPASPGTLYVSIDQGLLKTTDGGITWTTLLVQPFLQAIAVDAAHPGTLYVGTLNGVVKTVDGGATWMASFPFSVPITALVLDPSRPGTVYAGGLSGVFKSADGGATWALVSSEIGTGLITVGALALDPRMPDTLYAANGPEGGPDVGVWKTTDGGAHWAAVDAGLTDAYVYVLAVDPTNGSLYAGTASGLSKTTTGGASWAAATAGLIGLNVDAIVVDPTHPAVLYAAALDGGVWKSTDRGATWLASDSGLPSREVAALAIDPTQTSTLFASTRAGVYKSLDGGLTWQAANSGMTLPLDDSTFLQAALAIDPSHPATVYAGNDAGLWKTTDGGATWTGIAQLAFIAVTKLLIDPSQTGTLYAVAGFGLTKSTDGGATWTANYRAPFYISDMAIDPSQAGTLYAATLGGFFRSEDAGATWLRASCGLSTVSKGSGHSSVAVALAVDPRNRGTVYAAGPGVWKTVDGGATWNAVAADLPSGDVGTLAFDPTTSTLYAGTVGRSIFADTDTGRASTQPSVLCIDQQPGDARFTVQVRYQTAQAGGASGDGRAIPLASVGVTHGGLFWFFDAANPEMLVKLIDGCAVNRKHWLFYAAGTNVGLSTTVTDTSTGEVKTYTNPDLTAAPPVQDTGAFDCVGGDLASAGAPPGLGLAAAAPAGPPPAASPLPAPPPAAPLPAAPPACAPGPTTLCIDDRFQVQVSFQTSQGGGQSGQGQAVALDGLGVEQGGLFWFFSADNPEMLVKVLDGCALNGRWWVFYSAGTNVGLRLTVTDTTTGHAATYTNPDLTAAPPVQDTSALPCT